MANNKKQRKPKKNPQQSQQQRAKHRAAAIIKNNGHNLGFLGGMAWTATQVIGMQQAVAGNTSAAFKEKLADELQSNLRETPRTWTLAIAFVSKVDDEIVVSSVAKQWHDTTPLFLDKEGTEWMFEQSEELWGKDTFASLWISVPAAIDDGDSLFEEFDDELEAAGAYDPAHIADIKEKRQLIAGLRESGEGTTLRDKAHAIAKELQDAGYPVAVRLVNIGRYAYSDNSITDDMYIDIGGIDSTLVSTYLDESEAAKEEIVFPDNFGDYILEVASPIIRMEAA